MNSVHVNIQQGQIIVLTDGPKPIGYFTSSSKLMASVIATWSTHKDYLNGHWFWFPSDGGKGQVRHINGHSLDYRVVWLDEEHM
jgi:hypothetical protein